MHPDSEMMAEMTARSGEFTKIAATRDTRSDQMGPIADVLGGLRVQQESLEKALSVLADKIDPILGPNYPNAPDEDAQKRGPVSPLREELDKLAERNLKLVFFVNRLIDRVEL